MKIITQPLHRPRAAKDFSDQSAGDSFYDRRCPPSPEEELVNAVTDADLILGDYSGGTPITRRVVFAAKQLKLIQQPSAGITISISMPAAMPVFPLANTPGANDVVWRNIRSCLSWPA